MSELIKDVVRLRHDREPKYSDRQSSIVSAIKQLEDGHGEFNRAINHAIDNCSPCEARDFLQYWREGDWETCQEFGFEPKEADDVS